MSAATTLPRTSSTRRQQSAYTPPSDRDRDRDRDRAHGIPSNAHRSAPPVSSRRSMSASQQPPRSPPSHDHSPSVDLERVARQDFEHTNLAEVDPSHLNQSREIPSNGTTSHTHSPHADAVRSSASHGRTQSRYTDRPTAAPVAHPMDHRSPTNPPNLRRRTTIDSPTGHWELGKTVGAGSMGKVKLARNKETGEQVAVKIVPRQSTDSEHRTPQERERADHSKEIRTAREAAIVTLVDHPYICGMRDVVRTNYHWYMLCEYVNGGQMLDYIISHGRLKEKQARKFGRQIASALDYCHRNSIVHRDLKIENILISKTGDIKIIDFGLSNLFSPKNHLKTFCGSLYFAAPELLQAKQYTGPEVDLWSFGIVLYVLVCGKVPFDDQSMPQLHAKIKKGVVEYPPWLSPECRGLIARMLTTNPSERATLQEIMNHPWMTKGFNGPPDNYLPQRRPLQLPLDQSVIEKMTGFDFGDAETIASQLTKVVESEDYQRAVRLQERRFHQQPQEADQKRGVFNFYKRRSSATSRDTLNTPSSEALQLGLDPINAFHPLISIYYLAMEKQDRETKEKNPGALALPKGPGDRPIAVPDLPAPEAAYTNTSAYEMAGEKPTGGRSRPRARTHGEEEARQDLKNDTLDSTRPSAHPTIVEPAVDSKPSGHVRKESTAAGLLRRFSKRERGERPSHPPSSLDKYNTAEIPRKSFSMRRTRDSSQTRENNRPETSGSKQSELLTPPLGEAAPVPKRSHGLGRSISVNSSDMRRRLSKRGAFEGPSMRPQLPNSSSADQKVSFDHGSSIKEAVSDVESNRPSTFSHRTRSMGHARQESMQVRRARRHESRTADVPEETDQEMLDESFNRDGGGASSPMGMKPVYLKGFWSSSTTTSKPLHVIRADIIRVLTELAVEYREDKGGFSCRHAPSIKQAGAVEVGASSSQFMSPPLDNSHKRKISFGGFRDRNTTERDTAQSSGQRSKPSYANSEEDSEEDQPAPHPRASEPRPAGETSTHVQTDMGTNMTLRFEIVVVKVPLLSLHGIQFKKVEGGTWQYKNMAQKILNELRL